MSSAGLMLAVAKSESEDKAVGANAAFVAANRARAEAVYGSFAILGL
jgi:hypothetical protein